MLFSKIIEHIARKPYLQLNLSRSGIYDQLPEGLFYQPNKTINQPLDAANMAAEYRSNKKRNRKYAAFSCLLKTKFSANVYNWKRRKPGYYSVFNPEVYMNTLSGFGTYPRTCRSYWLFRLSGCCLMYIELLAILILPAVACKVY